jgi:hypothetical protein
MTSFSSVPGQAIPGRTLPGEPAQSGAPAGYLYLGYGWGVLYYLDYVDLVTSETLRAVTGNSYSMQAVSSRAGLTDPPPDGRWQGEVEMMTSFRPGTRELAAARAHNARLHVRLARGERIADLEALIAQGEEI